MICPECGMNEEEIARLRAEIERLTKENICLLADDPLPTNSGFKKLRNRVLHRKLVQAARGIQHWKHERDEALANVEAARILVEEAKKNKQEALAQVAAALTSAVEWTLKRLTRQEDWPMSWEAKFPGLKAQAILDLASVIPAEARALLDRLQRVEDERASLAEDCGEMRKQITRQLVQLQRVEAALVGYAKGDSSLITDWVAAWEEGKA